MHYRNLQINVEEDNDDAIEEDIHEFDEKIRDFGNAWIENYPSVMLCIIVALDY